MLGRDIIEGVLPPGSRLVVSELTDRYGVSPTPLREALQRLAAQGLVEIDPRQGAAVAPISLEHLHDTYAIRDLLESRAVKFSVEQGDDRWAADLRSAFTDFTASVMLANETNSGAVAWSRPHRDFHVALMAACGSPWTVRLLDTISTHTERYRLLSAQSGGRDPITEHAAIFEAAVARESGRAVAALQEHLARTVQSVEAYFHPQPAHLETAPAEAR
jgi:GntR family transcriptional regulator, carbon starvation induced regulator